MNRKSKRFTENKWSTYLVPALLLVILSGLLVTLIVVIMTVTGL